MKKDYTKPQIEAVKINSESIAAAATSVNVLAAQDSYKVLDITNNTVNNTVTNY